MEDIFESIAEHEDYDKTAEKIFYAENQDKLEKIYTKEQFLKLARIVKERIAEQLNLNFKFVLTFSTAITAFYPIVESFILNSGVSQVDINQSTIIYLTICALAIVFESPKETYRKLFAELRLRNVYGFLENLTSFIKKMKELFMYICKLIGRAIRDTWGMFNYTVLFVPFALTFAQIVDLNGIDLNGIIEAMGADGLMKLTTIGIGVASITLREILIKLVDGIINFDWNKVRKYLSRSFSTIKDKVNNFIGSLKGKIKTEEIKKDLKEREVQSNKERTDMDMDIKKFQQWKDENDLPDNVERIDEEK